MEETDFDFSAIRTRLHKEISNIIVEESETITGVTGWILVVESAHGQANRSLYAISGDIIGDNDLPIWTARGWLDEISDNAELYLGPDPDWGEEDDDD